MLKKGDKIPAFQLVDQNNQMVDIGSYIGKYNLVIYFYPKDDTPGCTAEACSFRDQFEEFTDKGAIVIGISEDSPQSHKHFAEKYSLPFKLLSDPGNKVRKTFGVPSSLFGLIPGRVTYICNNQGEIKYIFNSQFNAKKHVKEALKILSDLT